MIRIEVDDREVQAALKALAERTGNLGPALKEIGEEIVERAKQRFSTGTGPDGAPWKPNARSTIRAALARGIANKKPLIGESKDLSRQIFATVAGNTLTVNSSPIYAAIHQFGGSVEIAAHSRRVRHRTDAKGQLLRTKDFKGKGLIFAKDAHKRAVARWFEVKAHRIDIPARPFLPVRADGTLYPADAGRIVEILRQHLAGG